MAQPPTTTPLPLANANSSGGSAGGNGGGGAGGNVIYHNIPGVAHAIKHVGAGSAQQGVAQQGKTVGGADVEFDGLQLYLMLLHVRGTWAFRLMPKELRERIINLTGGKLP